MLRAPVQARECAQSDFSSPANDAMTFCATGDYAFAKGVFSEHSAADFGLFLKNHQNVNTIFFQSGGGLAKQGARIGEIIRNSGFDTAVHGICASSCVLAYLGGKKRYISARGKLGFHRAALLVERSKAERKKIQVEILTALKNYFAAMGAHKTALDPAWKRSLFSMHWYSRTEMRKWNLATNFQAKKPAPPARAFKTKVLTSNSAAFPCGLMETYINEWNRKFSKKWIDRKTRILWGTTNCGERRVRIRYQLKANKNRLSKASQAASARSVFCRDTVLREQMRYGWQVWFQIDFLGKKTRTVITSCG